MAEAWWLALTGEGAARRKRARLSVRQVAEAIGVGGPTLARWEMGDRRPTGDPALAWVRLLRQLGEDAQAFRMAMPAPCATDDTWGTIDRREWVG